MKAQLHKLPIADDTSFLYNKWQCDYFDKPWHFHEEYELVLIDKSCGTKLIGDSVSLFEDGSLFLIGSNIPHLFRNNEDYYSKKSPGASSIFIHFKEDTFGNDFLNLPELKPVRKLLDNAGFALEIQGKIKKEITTRLQKMEHENPTLRLLSLLEILVKLSQSKELKPLLSAKFTNNNLTTTRDTNRVQKILEYIMKNYTGDIYMSDVASMFNMSDASFSRYFKHHTRKTFSNYVTEIRISNACRLIMNGEENISQIGYRCGFENLSNFYRHFNAITGLSPKNYRKRFYKITDKD